jgi:hypothetical protein
LRNSYISAVAEHLYWMGIMFATDYAVTWAF